MLKRIFDFVLALIVIVTLLPFSLVLAIPCLFFLPSPMLLKLPRVGKNEKLFFLYRFNVYLNSSLCSNNKRSSNVSLRQFLLEKIYIVRNMHIKKDIDTKNPFFSPVLTNSASSSFLDAWIKYNFFNTRKEPMQ